MVFAWGLVDYFGRRRSMLLGISLQLAAHIYMSVYMAELYQDENKVASNAAIASIFIYAVGWSIGLCTVQYLYGTEIFPTRIRSVCYAANMAVHWFFQFAVVRVTPNLFVAFNVWGAFVFWASICAIGLVFLGVMAPETKQVLIEKMDELFANSWYMGWKGKVETNRRASLVDIEETVFKDFK
jgi:MFS family permease